MSGTSGLSLDNKKIATTFEENKFHLYLDQLPKNHSTKYILKMFLFCSFSRAKIYFREDFDDYSLDRWKVPEKVRKGVQLGKVRASTGDFYGDERKWRGMETMDSRRFYYLSPP